MMFCSWNYGHRNALKNFDLHIYVKNTFNLGILETYLNDVN